MSKNNSIKYTPVRGYVLVKPLGDQQPTSFVVEDANETPRRAEVVAVGEKTWYEHLDREFESPCKVGDIVIHSAFGFENLLQEGINYRIVPFGKILLVEK